MGRMLKSWDVESTKSLFASAERAKKEEKPLAGVFKEFSKILGQSEGSVRNYYYAHLSTFRLMPDFASRLGIRFEPRGRTFLAFGDGEGEELVRKVLIRRAKGQSVRRIVEDLSGNNPRLALRLQNKYRSLVFRQKERTVRIIKALSDERVTFFHPYVNQICTDGILPTVTNPEPSGGVLTTLAGMIDILEKGNPDKLLDLKNYLSNAAKVTTSINN